MGQFCEIQRSGFIGVVRAFLPPPYQRNLLVTTSDKQEIKPVGEQ